MRSALEYFRSEMYLWGVLGPTLLPLSSLLREGFSAVSAVVAAGNVASITLVYAIFVVVVWVSPAALAEPKD